MLKLFLLLTFFFCNYVSSQEIIFDVTGVAKVGKQCFLNFEVKDNSRLQIKNIDLFIYGLDSNNSLLGKSKITLKKLRKKQPYKTFMPIETDSVELCKNIKKVDLVVSKCLLSNNEYLDSCINLFKIARVEENEFYNSIEVNFSKNNSYYLDNSKEDFFIPELNVRIKVLDMEIAKRYKIKNYKNGLVVVNNNGGSFKEGDLIIEAEMNSISKVNDLNENIKFVKRNKKKSILISLIREQQEKLVAVLLK